MKKTNFKADFNDGRAHEIEAIKRVLKLHKNFKLGIQQDETNYKDVHYDFQVVEPSNIFTLEYEVKYDRLVNYTNNFLLSSKIMTATTQA